MDTEEKLSKELRLLANPLARRIIFKLLEKPINYGETVKELIEGTNASIGNFYSVISKLEKCGIVRKTGKYGKMYEITQYGINVSRILMIFYDLLNDKSENCQGIDKYLVKLLEKTKEYKFNLPSEPQHKVKKYQEKSGTKIIMEIMEECKKLTEDELVEKIREKTGKTPDIDYLDRVLQILKGKGKLFIDKNGCWCLQESQ